MDKIYKICKQFGIIQGIKKVDKLTDGHINGTYKVLLDDGKGLIVQQLNTKVFQSPEKVMSNVRLVTEHIAKKHPDRINLLYFDSPNKKNYIICDDEFWRVCNFISSKTYNCCNDSSIMKHAGMAFGEFQFDLQDLNPYLLSETIEGFHDTTKRFKSFLSNLERAIPSRIDEVKGELKTLLLYSDLACSFSDMRFNSSLPTRITHNDTKINNVLFDINSGNAIAVIDLDTTMPGLLGHDFADTIRTAANNTEEDSVDTVNTGINEEMFIAFASGFLQKTGSFITQREKETLVLATFSLTLEQAVRFLDDYLMGDKYYQIEYPKQNLYRAKVQIALALDILRKRTSLEAIIKSL